MAKMGPNTADMALAVWNGYSCTSIMTSMCRMLEDMQVSDTPSKGSPATYATRWGVFVQLLYPPNLRRCFDSQVPRPIDRNKSRFPRAPVCRILV